jgi:(p)ppGpp synthase/HD superfamily hydrolase
MSLIDQAIEFAANKYRHQQRKGTDIPYVSHPYGVGLILLQAKCKEEVIITGILHDTLEDTDTTEEEIRNQFGQIVLDLVKGCSEPDKGESWEERKKHTHDYLKQAALSICQVAFADKLHNLRSINGNLKELGEKAWERFNRGCDAQAWYYTEIVESLGYMSRFPLLDVLQDEMETVFRGTLENGDWKKFKTK